MSTDATTGKGPAPRIVRIGPAIAPLLAGGAVLSATWFGASRDAWVPFGAAAEPEAWQQPLSRVQGALATLQMNTGQVLLPNTPIVGGLVVAAVLGAVLAAGLVVALRRTGLHASLALLLAAVASSAPLAQWQAASPLGLVPLSLASLAVLLWTMHRPRRWPAVASITAGRVLLAVALGLALVNDGLLPLVRLVRAELGLIGLVCVLATWLPTPDDTTVAHRHTARAGTVLVLLLTAWLPPLVRLAVLLPWLWTLVALGVAAVLQHRAGHAHRWATVGLACWVAIHAAQVPWGQRRQAAAAARTWAEGVVAAVTSSRPLVIDTSARGHLAATLVRARHGSGALVATDDVRTQVQAGRTPIVVDVVTRDRWRSAGVGFASPVPDAGVPLHAVLEAFPPDTVVLAAISRDAAARLTPEDWVALSHIGIRSADAGQARAHVVAGLTHVRVAGLHRAGPDHARLDVQPGDPLGRIASRSPLDARLEATATDVTLTLRGRRLHDDRGLLVTFWTTRGDLIAWHSGTEPQRVHGAASARGDATVSEALLALPCVEVPAARPVDITPAAQAGGLTVLAAARAARVEVALTLPDGATAGPFAWIGAPPAGATLRTRDAEHVVLDVGPAAPPASVALRRRVGQATASSTVPVTICGTWPMPGAIDPAARPLHSDMGPGDEAYVSDGWHDREGTPGQHFRWTAGRRATLVVALRQQASLEFALDAQTADDPTGGDAVRVSVNGQALPPRALVLRRARYVWTIPADASRRGLNTIEIASSRTVRPADRAAGADGRTLGLAIHGWSLAAAPDDPSRNEYILRRPAH